MENLGLLPMDAIIWLMEQGFRDADHNKRMELIREAREHFKDQILFGED